MRLIAVGPSRYRLTLVIRQAHPWACRFLDAVEVALPARNGRWSAIPEAAT
jgi:hypothetical protein